MLSVPSAVCAGEEFQVSALIVKNAGTPPVHFVLDGENTFVDSENGRVVLDLPDFHPWTCEDPFLYKIKIDVGEDGMILEGLDGDDNFLPDAYTVSMHDLNLYEDTITRIQAIEGVDHYTDYSDIANKLANIDMVVRVASLAIIVVLGVVSLFIISNTVKVTMFSRRTEISIMKSVGATNGFVRIPFIVEGMIIGIISGGISAGILLVAYDWAVLQLYSIVPFLTAVDIDPFVWYIVAAYAVIGALFGIFGGGISIGKYLNKEGENAVA